jgi:hypothetical protein
MAFSNPYKYIKLNLTNEEQDNWDDSIDKSDNKFKKEEHNLCWYYLFNQ